MLIPPQSLVKTQPPHQNPRPLPLTYPLSKYTGPVSTLDNLKTLGNQTYDALLPVNSSSRRLKTSLSPTILPTPLTLSSPRNKALVLGNNNNDDDVPLVHDDYNNTRLNNQLKQKYLDSQFVLVTTPPTLIPQVRSATPPPQPPLPPQARSTTPPPSQTQLSQSSIIQDEEALFKALANSMNAIPQPQQPPQPTPPTLQQSNSRTMHVGGGLYPTVPIFNHELNATLNPLQTRTTRLPQSQPTSQTPTNTSSQSQNSVPGYLERKIALDNLIKSIAPIANNLEPNPRIEEIHDVVNPSQHQNSQTTPPQTPPQTPPPPRLPPQQQPPSATPNPPPQSQPQAPTPPPPPQARSTTPPPPQPQVTNATTPPPRLPPQQQPRSATPPPLPPQAPTPPPSPRSATPNSSPPSQLQMQVTPTTSTIVGPTNSSSEPVDIDPKLIAGFIDYLNGINPKLVSSETNEKEVPSKAGEDKKLIENITELLSKIEKKELDSLLEKLKKLIENPQSNEKLIEKDVKDKDENKVTTNESLLGSFIKFLKSFTTTPRTVIEPKRATPLIPPQEAKLLQGG